MAARAEHCVNPLLWMKYYKELAVIAMFGVTLCIIGTIICRFILQLPFTGSEPNWHLENIKDAGVAYIQRLLCSLRFKIDF